MFPSMTNDSTEGFIMLASCLHPRSRGHVVLTSIDPRESISIEPNYLKNSQDLACMRDGTK